MKIVYQRNFNSNEVNKEMLDKLYSFYVLSDFLFIPVINHTYRSDDMMNEIAKCNEEIINEVLCSVKKEYYYGTYRHADDLFSDYYESNEYFVNVFFNIAEENFCYIEAILYTYRTDIGILKK